jgi:serine/threonine-protein kinase RsbT
MEAEFQKALAVLERYISPFNARALLLRVLRDQRLSPETLTQRDLRKCSTALRQGVGLFVEANRRQNALSDISELCGSDSMKPQGCLVDIVTENDISRVRAEARRICDAIGTSAFTMQKVATIVSELARNMVLYANGGIMEIVPVSSGARRIVVRAIDKGPGIPDLTEVLSGRYKSRTGLGRGLLGTKRLADHFDVSTSPRGTLVTAEVTV